MWLRQTQELTIEECNLLLVVYKNGVVPAMLRGESSQKEELG